MKSFGIGFVVGAALSPTVMSTFNTVEQKIKATSNTLKQANQQASVVGEALSARTNMLTLSAQYKAGGKTDANLAAQLESAKTIDGTRNASGKLTAKYYEIESAVKTLGRTLPLTHAELAQLFAAGGQQGLSDTGELQEFTTMAAMNLTDLTTFMPPSSQNFLENFLSAENAAFQQAGLPSGMGSQGFQQASFGQATPAISANFSFSVNGVPDADFARRVIDALKSRKQEFEHLLGSVVNDRRRLAYGA